MSEPTGFLVEASGTDLAVTEETLFNAKVPPVTGWHRCQVNTYQSIGAAMKKTPRNPISQSLQLQKGMLTDEDSGFGINVDITKDSIDRWSKGTFRALPIHNGNKQVSSYAVSAVTTTGYTVGASGDLAQRTLVVARGLVNDANNGLKMIGAGSIGTEAKTTGLVAEGSPPSNAVLDVAGYRGTTSDLGLDASGNLVSQTSAVDFTTWHLADFQWIWIGGADPSLAFGNTDFIGAARVARGGVSAHKITFDQRTWDVQLKSYLDLATKTTNVDTVVESVTAGPGGDATTVAFVGDGVAAAKAFLALTGHTGHIDTVIEAKTGGTAGNNITVEIVVGAGAGAGVLTELGTHVKLQIKSGTTTVTNFEALVNTSTLIEVKTPGTGATVLDGTDAMASLPLAGGTDATAVSVAEVGSAVTVHYTPAFSTVAQIEAAIAGTSTLLEVKTHGTAGHVLQAAVDAFAATNLAHGADGTDNGAGKTIDVYFSRYYANVARNSGNFGKVSYVAEVTYPELYAGQPGYHYPRGNVLDTTVYNIPATSKATMDLTFMGATTPNPTNTRKTGPVNALDPVTNVGVSTSVDLAHLRISDVDDTGISTDLESLKITIKNNITMQKELAHLGGFAPINGQMELTVDASLVFTNPEAIIAVRSNITCRMDVLMRNSDFGALLDVHAMTFDTAGVQIVLNKAVMLTAKTTGFQNALSGSTAGLSMFAYLPPAVEDND